MEMHTYGDFGRDRPNRGTALLRHPLRKGLQGRHFHLIHIPDLPSLAAPDPSLSSEGDLDFYCRCLALPWRRQDGVLTVATADTTPANLARLRTHYGDSIGVMPLAKPLLLRVLEERFAGTLLEKATHSLVSRFPEFSARQTITGSQIGFFVLLAAAILVAVFVIPAAANFFLAAALSMAFVANAVFRLVLVWVGAGCSEKSTLSKSPVDDSDLPLYSIVVPLYREANVVPSLIAALRRLDYPAGRIEIILVLEVDDAETIAAARIHASDPLFSILRVPPGLPRTKPKAANYALNFVHGEFTTIYDAEDRPEPDQLRKAVAAFRSLPPSVVCLQARLNFYNADENWLTRMFALDYALWFDLLLPGLDKFGIPMPLGGTSNHFRTSALRAIEGWDPYNMTEDADLGIRLAQLGLRVATLDSTTYEEATVTFGGWLRQRSRWMKGYMQTWLVHMRSPFRLLRHAGFGGFVGFQLFVGGAFLTTLLNPVLWIVCLCSPILGDGFSAGFAAAPFSHVPLLGLIAGNGLFTYLAMLGPCRRGWLDLVPYGFGAPFYWALISVACYRGAWDLMMRPMHWEKTSHGMSRQKPQPFATIHGVEYGCS